MISPHRRWLDRGGAHARDRARAVGHAVRTPNLRWYLAGYLLSMCGTWTQTLALNWLIVAELGGGGQEVASAILLRFLPVLALAPWGGLLADRLPKRTILLVTQVLWLLNAAALWGLTEAELVSVTIIYVLNTLHGVVDGFYGPAATSILSELVQDDGDLRLALGLSMVASRLARFAGPVLATAIIGVSGIATCFLVNALSFAAMAVALLRVRPASLRAAERVPRARGQVRQGLRYVAADPALWIPMVALAVIANISYTFESLLPLLASETWQGTDRTYAALSVAAGVGAVLGGVVSMLRPPSSTRILVISAAGFGVCEILVALAPVLWLQIAALVGLGVVAVVFVQATLETVQINAAPQFRGRVAAVVGIATAPLGAPLTGWMADTVSPRFAMAFAGGTALAVAMGIATAAAITERRREGGADRNRAGEGT